MNEYSSHVRKKQTGQKIRIQSPRDNRNKFSAKEREVIKK